MLKQEKSRAAAAEASLHGASVSSNTHQQTATSTKDQKATVNSDTPHHDYHSQNDTSSSDHLTEQQRSHRASRKGTLEHQIKTTRWN